MKYIKIFNVFFIFVLILTCISCGKQKDEYTKDGRLILNYWEKWTGFEGDAMKAVVDEFNKSQNKIFVRYVPVSKIDRKLLVATAGGDPPDIAGIWSWAVNIYADKGAIISLDDLAKGTFVNKDYYVPFFFDLCSHRGKLWAVPTTPATIGLYWNKRLFREAGLDPDKPPAAIQEIDKYNEILTKYKLTDGKIVTYRELIKMPDYKNIMKGSKIIQMGFLPFEPGWWNEAWGYWFGGDLWNGKDKITINSPENIKAMKWVQSYPEKYGKDQVEMFSSGFAGQFASSQNAYLCGKLAMEIQGVWMYNFISKYSPGMDWGAAPFPSATPSLKNVTVGECDVLVIPKGARHPKESFEFMKFVNLQKNMEMLCLGQRKFSPLKKISKEFYKKNQHPAIRIFRKLSESENCRTMPVTGIWMEYKREFQVYFQQIRNLETTPEKALKELQDRVQRILDRERQRLKRRGIIK